MEQPREARSRAMARPMPFVAPLGKGVLDGVCLFSEEMETERTGCMGYWDLRLKEVEDVDEVGMFVDLRDITAL